MSERMAAARPGGSAAAGVVACQCQPGIAGGASPCAVELWARSGAMHLTGRPQGPPSAPAAPVLARVAAGLGEFGVDGARLLSARGWEMGWSRQGSMSANGSARLLPTADGWVAVNLPRPSDLTLVPAVIEHEIPAASEWEALAGWLKARDSTSALGRLHLLGLAAAAVGEEHSSDAVSICRFGSPQVLSRPRVLDFSALWAGPLAARLLAERGLAVLSVADTVRPDDSHRDAPGFRDWLRAGREHRLVDLHDAPALQALADDADVIIEASRPRALRALGLDAERWLAASPGRVWLSITGYGRTRYDGLRIAYGDDAAVAGGLVAWDAAGPMFCADAIADPLTGLRGAREVVASLARGGGELIDLRMAGVCAELARVDGPRIDHRLEPVMGGWSVTHPGRPSVPVSTPRP